MRKDHLNSQKRFVGQSYCNAVADFDYSLNGVGKAWDFVIITSSNESQAISFRNEIEIRKKERLIPLKTQFLVVPDKDGKRIGSGGATINALFELSRVDKHFLKKKILLIHSGGDSKRIPQYSICGKLFSPVPRSLNNLRQATLFDDILALTRGVAERMPDGMLVVSGDVEFVFSPLQFDFANVDAAMLTAKVAAGIGVNHGVFVADESGNVSKCLQKMSLDVLRKENAVDEFGLVNLDTGFVWLSSAILSSIMDISTGPLNSFVLPGFVDENVRLNFYSDFLFPLASSSTLCDFLKAPGEVPLNDNLLSCRTAIWNSLSHYRAKLFLLAPSSFLHFGTTKEMFRMLNDIDDCYGHLKWTRNILSHGCESCAGFEVIAIDSSVSSKAFLERTMIQNCTVGSAVLSNISANNRYFPDGLVFQTVRLKDGSFVTRVFGIDDNPKNDRYSRFLCSSIESLEKQIQKQSGNNEFSFSGQSIWDADIFLPEHCSEDSLDDAFMIVALSEGKEVNKEQLVRYISSHRYSLSSSFSSADCHFQEELHKNISYQWTLKRVVSLIKESKDLYEISKAFPNFVLESWNDAEEDFDPFTVSRLLYLSSINCGKAGRIKKRRDYLERSRLVLSKPILEAHARNISDHYRIECLRDTFVELPARVNFFGGYSDAAPYCLEKGGSVLNCSVLLNGLFPISVSVKRIPEKAFVFRSIDCGVETKYRSLDFLKKPINPHDSFGLFIACIISTGLFSNNMDVFAKINGGIEIATFANIPKGSGLGTSSILACGIIKALFNGFGVNASDDVLFSSVFAAEQLLGTGGGWQDQVGGFVRGLKLISSIPGFDQRLSVSRLNISEPTKKALSERIILIFSGQRRMAKNVLFSVMDKAFVNDDNAIKAFAEIKRMSAAGRKLLEDGDLDAFAHLLTSHFEVVKRIDSGVTNDCIDLIFDSLSDFLEGYSICGAGGGGFLVGVLRHGITKNDVSAEIESAFHGCGVTVYDSEIVF